MSHLIETTIPPLYQTWDISQMVGADNLEEIKQKVSQYLLDPLLEKNGHNLYLYSIENGTGKTSLAYYILGQIHGPRKIIYEDSPNSWHWEITPVLAVKFANYLKFCNDPYNQDSKNAKKQVETTPFLLLDDVSPWANSSNLQADKREFVLLMMYRREHLLPTVITSNLTPETFEKMYGATVSSKVLENFSYIEVRGADVRPALFPDTFAKEDYPQ